MKKYISGQSLFETIVALGVVGLVLLALVSLATLAIRNSTYSKNTTLATRHSQEAVEWLRAERDTGWADFDGHNGTFCINELNWSHGGGCGSSTIPGTVFSREVTMTDTGADTITAQVSTTWTDGRGDHDARASTIFTNWN